MDSQTTRTNRWRRRALWMGAIAIGFFGGLAAGGVIGGVADAHGALRAWGHCGGHGDRDPEAMRRHADFAVSWGLSQLDASPAQEEAIQGIVGQAIDDLTEIRGGHRETHDALLELLGDPEIDRARLEAIRASEVERLDTLSNVLTSRLADVADVLTPEQRASLIEHVHGHRHEGALR